MIYINEKLRNIKMIFKNIVYKLLEIENLAFIKISFN